MQSAQMLASSIVRAGQVGVPSSAWWRSNPRISARIAGFMLR